MLHHCFVCVFVTVDASLSASGDADVCCGAAQECSQANCKEKEKQHSSAPYAKYEPACQFVGDPGKS